MSDPLVSTAWLAERLGDPAIQVVDATWFMPGDPMTGARSYADGHIRGAVFFDIDAIADHSTDLPHMLPAPAAFAQAAGELGLRREATVVVYDAQGLFSGPRVWWTLRTMGFPDVVVLDGGLKKWRAEERPIETAPASPPATTPAPAFDAALVRDLADVRAALADGATQVIDARPAGRFSGETPEPRAGLRSGHMPGACNVPFAGLVSADGTLKPIAELRTAFQAAAVDLGRPIVTTCGSGVSAAILALALARLGRFDVAVYDGSWTEWGGRADTEVVTGA
ncbi:MAG: 3-mercaptopyruvate sulfurtransferase [Phenylobacterium sp.]|uniref:3-mercaptopyruvate sulfurtransferase n=1 Tax=Phenylobacterium sp. TaxID=1871053 RepID=UPI0025FCF842|nr:3-mercaptopyruvate sulfurtransferase [Phenylobacterium sp.]MBI1198137.1 3-mercaptopyruvate sulfurtransferase [Phenylobacterium sp.]